MTAATSDVAVVPADRRLDDRLWFGIIAFAALGGALLRGAMAQGDLWLDEVWSLELVRPLGSAADIFTALSHDNNHFLNSLWLFWLGPDRAPWAYRLPSVGLGTASVALAAAIPWRRSRAAAAAAALLAAVAMPLVTYGSEARGYAGLIAAILLAIAAFERALDPRAGPGERRRAGWLLGAAVCLGTLWHLTMVFSLAVLGFAALVHFAQEKPVRHAVDSTLALFRPALFGLVPAAAALVAGILRTGGFQTGASSPATLATFLRGYGDQLDVTLGLPPTVPISLCVATAGLLVLAAARSGRLAPTGPAMLLGAIIVLPCGMLLCRLPNLEFARYYMVTGLVLLLAVATLVGALWDDGRPAARLLAVAVLVLLGGAQLAADAHAVRTGRGRYGEALTAMADAGGRVRYATLAPFWVDGVAAAAARNRGLTTEPVTGRAFCRLPPGWLIDVPETEADLAHVTIMAGPAGCRVPFALDRVVETNPLSGMRWMIYRRAARAGDGLPSAEHD